MALGPAAVAPEPAPAALAADEAEAPSPEAELVSVGDVAGSAVALGSDGAELADELLVGVGPAAEELAIGADGPLAEPLGSPAIAGWPEAVAPAPIATASGLVALTARPCPAGAGPEGARSTAAGLCGAAAVGEERAVAGAGGCAAIKSDGRTMACRSGRCAVSERRGAGTAGW